VSFAWESLEYNNAGWTLRRSKLERTQIRNLMRFKSPRSSMCETIWRFSAPKHDGLDSRNAAEG
jgi:hypothetical protein